ncbi:winged helix-turn-helix transcriptional regulator [Aestuariicella hydrocarbonica]|uniref:Winged helix-turn-helix transcriptional regulator n=1 Tax=Pseudomaricurvus hydrocarbonicus TaxID=1470433 RepID=A0A9E5JUE8_9GAMM|nr:MarR family winged helix-turn-helix transcriptional regulator [Aestuariicella hydrocarbonica]NHO65671.1 winged helix-turn-helix transcriptional regulator [Aestuariicella hydrocarbonica]
MTDSTLQTKNTASKAKSRVAPCFALSLRKANRVLTQFYDRDMSPHGIKITQFAILRAVYYLGEATNRSLQNVLVLDQTTLSRNLKPLLRDGYLETRPGRDKREKVLQLTAAGKQLFHAAAEDWQQTQSDLKALLGDELIAQLLTVGDAIVDLKDTSS